MEDKNKFENALSNLEEVVKKLESDIPLNEAVKEFEKGINLSKICMEDLKAEKGKLSILMDELNNITEQFDIE